MYWIAHTNRKLRLTAKFVRHWCLVHTHEHANPQLLYHRDYHDHHHNHHRADDDVFGRHSVDHMPKRCAFNHSEHNKRTIIVYSKSRWLLLLYTLYCANKSRAMRIHRICSNIVPRMKYNEGTHVNPCTDSIQSNALFHICAWMQMHLDWIMCTHRIASHTKLRYLYIYLYSGGHAANIWIIEKPQNGFIIWPYLLRTHLYICGQAISTLLVT